ncbi:uncharacterized protein LOC144436936 [Glandiceps talaboti]
MICGDLNIHVNNVKDHSANKFNDICQSRNLTQHVSVPTHTSGNTLDLIITRDDNRLSITPPVSGHYISDHCFVITHLSNINRHIEENTVTFRQYKKINKEAFRNDILNSSLCDHALLNNSDLDSLVSTYNTVLTELLDKHAPLITKRFTTRPTLPWINDEIRLTRRLRRRAERKWRQNQNHNSRLTFKQFRNKLSNRLENACTDYYCNAVSECQGDQKKLYSIVNSLMRPPKLTLLPDHDCKTELANKFNNFFVDKVANIRQKLDDQAENTALTDGFRSRIVDTNLNKFTPLKPDEIKKYIMKSPTKQCQSDPIPTWLLKEYVNILLPIITCMTNRSLQIGTFPAVWKEATVIPLIKKTGGGTELSNYRPVSNLPFISKLVERVVADQLTKHMQINAPLPIHQSAYKQHHSIQRLFLVKLYPTY